MKWEVINGKDGLPAHVITDKGDHYYLLPDLGPMWFPDLDIAAAWEVVEKLCPYCYIDIGVDKYGAQVQIDIYDNEEWKFAFVESTRAETAPLAVCRVAIKAKGNSR